MKYFWMKAQTNFSATYSYASGRPYFNPNATSFLADRAPAFQNLALTVSYLTTIKKMFTVFYLSIDNITNRKNIFLILSFVIRSSLPCIIPILRILLMLLCQKTSSFVMCDRRRAQDSHPHSSKLPGMAMSGEAFLSAPGSGMERNSACV